MRHRVVVLALLALLGASASALAQMGGGGHGHRQRDQSDTTPRRKTPAVVPDVPEIWPRLEDGAVVCKSREDLVKFQTKSGPSASPAAQSDVPGCRTIQKKTGIQILDHDGPSRTQIVTTDDAKETGWTNTYLPSTPPASVAKPTTKGRSSAANIP